MPEYSREEYLSNPREFDRIFDYNGTLRYIKRCTPTNSTNEEVFPPITEYPIPAVNKKSMFQTYSGNMDLIRYN